MPRPFPIPQCALEAPAAQWILDLSDLYPGVVCNLSSRHVGSFMGRISRWLSKLGLQTKDGKLSEAEAEQLRAAFKARYLNFRLLLSANNKALEIMTDMEKALKGGFPFGISFVRANCTAVGVNVYRIIRNLDQLAPGKYLELYDQFKEIQENIHRELSRKKEPAGDSLVLFFDRIDKETADQVGSKMANLGEVRNRLSLTVPNGFVVTALAYRKFFEFNDLQTEIDRRLQSSRVEEMDQLYALSADLQQIIIRSRVPPELEEAIQDAYRRLEEEAGRGVRVSMRSSALGEDAAGTSFAGQYRSELNVSPDDLIQAYKEIVASKYSPQAISYRLNRGILDEDIAMCVGCMVMVPAVVGGVTYSRNPLHVRDDSIIIHSVWGLPKSVVDGSAASDVFIVGRSPSLRVLERKIPRKDYKFVCYAEEGVCRMEMSGETASRPSLTDKQAIELAGMASRLEEYYGTPQDVEWAVDEKGRAYTLQCRPLKLVEVPASQTARLGEVVAEGEVIVEGGTTAGPGAACGPVFLVQRTSDALQFPQGAVLVVSQALPRWAALLSRAAAVVAGQGSVAGHLANVAREFGIPALFGVRRVTEILQTGETVTVDADGTRIYKGKIENLLEVSHQKRNLMLGSPVHEVLEDVSRHIIPLNLLDPDSTDFKPKKCRTLHDITRFCHEKSVHEMFSFGEEHRFSERASKQLVCGIPMQWWLINLDDGFKEDVPGKFVELDNIVSIPMLALWEGIVAVPWEGPPPVDVKGFMSVLMEASANPALDPSMPSPYANRNYFMISRNFCTLSSRFGFHFSTIEVLVGERAQENYVSFHFKGGAADAQRRIRRACFVAEIVEEFGFRTEVKEDGVFARIEGYEESVMKEKLKILGYLIIHTRQLDMVMSNDFSYNQQRTKLMGEIRMILQGKSAPGGASDTDLQAPLHGR